MEFLEQNSIYIVLIISLMIWLGIVFYLFRIDSKLTKLEKMMLDSESESSEN